jgi:hypothetical protein
VSLPAEPDPRLAEDEAAEPRSGLVCTAGRGFRLLALTAFALHLVAGAWSALDRSAQRIATAYQHRHTSYLESRRVTFGEYALGLELAELAIRPGEEYLLITAVDDGYYLLLQGDLAPRLAFYDGEEARGLPPHWPRRGVPPHAPWAMIQFHGPDRPPTTAPLLEHPEAWARPAGE